MSWLRVTMLAKWACVSATVVLLLFWVTSGWYGLSWINGSGSTDVAVICGKLVVHRWTPHTPKETWHIWNISQTGHAPQWQWWFSANTESVGLPLWLPLLMTGIGGGLLWKSELRSERKRRAGLCPSCGYDRRGLAADAKCPECGTVPAPAAK